jgi:hypothetical protein
MSGAPIMNRVGIAASLAAATLVVVGPQLRGQDNPERVTAAFSDPSRAGTVKVALLQGSIVVKATNGKEVAAVARSRSGRSRDLPDPGRRSGDVTGLRRLNQPAGITIEEEGNVMTIGVGRVNDVYDLDVEVPARSNLSLRTVNGRQVTVEGVDGDIEVNAVNGSITLTDVAGSVVAHATNGRVLATLRQVTPQKAMAFTSLNGSVDVTLPAVTKASLKLRSTQGDVYTDFDVQLQPTPAATTSERTRDGRRMSRLDTGSIVGTINGGGPEIELRTFNGDVFVRKGK